MCLCMLVPKEVEKGLRSSGAEVTLISCPMCVLEIELMSFARAARPLNG